MVNNATWSQIALLFASSLLAAGCSNGSVQGPSADTQFLRDRLLPKLLEWSRSQEPSLDLVPLIKGRGYDHLCVILPYNQISDIAGKTPQRVGTYHSEATTSPSASGRTVVDGFALIAVKDDEAHSLWVRRSPLQITVNPEVACYRMGEAILRRISVRNSRGLFATLGHK